MLPNPLSQFDWKFGKLRKRVFRVKKILEVKKCIYSMLSASMRELELYIALPRGEESGGPLQLACILKFGRKKGYEDGLRMMRERELSIRYGRVIVLVKALELGTKSRPTLVARLVRHPPFGKGNP